MSTVSQRVNVASMGTSCISLYYILIYLMIVLKYVYSASANRNTLRRQNEYDQSVIYSNRLVHHNYVLLRVALPKYTRFLYSMTSRYFGSFSVILCLCPCYLSPGPMTSASPARASTTTENVSEMTESSESVDGTTDVPDESTMGEYRTHKYNTHISSN